MKPGLLIDWPAARYPDATAVVFGAERTNFREFDARVNRLAHGLVGLGLPRGARVGVLMPNRPACMEVFFAVGKAGVALVPLNLRGTAAEHAWILDDAGAEALVFGREFAEVAAAVRPQVTGLRTLLVAGGAAAGARAPEDLARGQPDDEPAVDVGEDDLERIHYTSGTSGRPKGVVITHGQSHHRLTQILINLDQPVGPGDVNLNVGPLTHAAGLMFTAYYVRGATNVVLERFEPEAVLAAIERLRVTSVLLVPSMLVRMLRVPGIERHDFRSLRRIWYGTAPMPAEPLREAIRVFGPVFRQNYGMSEASQPLTFLGPEDHVVDGPEEIVRRLRSAGRPALGVDLRVVDAEGKPVKPGEVGEIVYRSRHMFREYWRRPDETARAFRDGWFLTGDLATVDEDGYVYIVDRKHDLIISGGFNIFPREVEEAILAHPAVAEVAVVGVPDVEWGEVVKAVCVLKAGARATAEEIVAACRERLAGYKKPRIVEFVPELPKNAYGKVERRRLKETRGGT
jgi:acyl-CoA synthetase (AMP-forming)/AMP-acid ligase II